MLKIKIQSFSKINIIKMDKKSSPAFTMSSRLHQTINRMSPGPMTYTQKLNIVKHSNPNATIGKAQRITLKVSQGPAPGQYDIQRPLRPKSSCAVFPTYKQPELKQQKRKLGPGSYEPDYSKVLRKTVSSCKFSKNPKNDSYKNSKQVKGPGPMTYNPKIDTVYDHQPAVKFGHSSRIDDAKLKATIPGPGEYDTQSIRNYKSQSAFKFPKQKRQKQPKQQQKTPGRNSKFNPALDYKIQSEFESNIKQKKGFKIALSRREHNSTINVPGPTSYNSESKISQTKAPAFSITHTERKNILVTKDQIPGPNSYNPESPPKKRAGSALITSSRREFQKQIQKKIALPGPGQYEKAFELKTIGSGIKFTIPRNKISKEKQRMTEKRPGPWSYNPIEALKQSIKYGTLGKSERQSIVKKGVPGPADYDIKIEKLSSKKGVKIGSEKRSKQKILTVPAPNAYTIPSTIGNTKHYEKSGKREKIEKNGQSGMKQ